MDNIIPRELTVEFRHDMPVLKSSWGINWTASERASVFYPREVLRVRDR